MATPAQIEELIEALRSAHPKALFQVMDETQAGIGAVLRFLYTSEETVTAGKIAEYMHVSTARVAVLLKKMAAKGLIIRQSAPGDARVTVVQLSQEGRAAVEAMRSAVRTRIGAAIDRIGMERMLEFAATARELEGVFRHPSASA